VVAEVVLLVERLEHFWVFYVHLNAIILSQLETCVLSSHQTLVNCVVLVFIVLNVAAPRVRVDESHLCERAWGCILEVRAVKHFGQGIAVSWSVLETFVEESEANQSQVDCRQLVAPLFNFVLILIIGVRFEGLFIGKHFEEENTYLPDIVVSTVLRV